ncbi:MAG: hypothetical protein IJJ56_11675 [Prevotella sp.]|nr:hypothetical protein [Prevotella sp.]
MDYIFKEWEKKLSDFEGSVEKDLSEIRKCKAEIRRISDDLNNSLVKGRYLRDNQRFIISAPEIIIGNVDNNGMLLDGGSTIVLRGTKLGLQAATDGGQVELRAPSIREIAEDPGSDGQEHVVSDVSEVVSQARSVVIHSSDAQSVFSAPAVSGSGISLQTDRQIDIEAVQTAESRETRLTEQISGLEKQKSNLKDLASSHKESFKSMKEEMEKLLDKKDKLVSDEDNILSTYSDISSLNQQIDEAAMALSEETASYAEVLSLLAETNRQLKCLKDEKGKIKKGDDFKKNTTGAAVNIVGENISLISADGEGNLRDNEGSGIAIMGNSVSVASIESDGKLKEKGVVSIKACTIDVATAGETDQKYEKDGTLTTATYTSEGDFKLTSKNITIEGIDYEVKDKKLKEKQLTADSKIKLRAKTIEVSTEASANVEVDDQGKLTKANYTAEGDLIVRSKTVTVETTDTDLENGEAKEKALTKDGKVTIRAEKMNLSATDTEGKATGSIGINAKDVSVKSMDVEKEKRTDDKLAAGSTMVIVSEKMFVGAKSKDVKSKKMQAVSEEMGLFADKTFEAQQGDGKAVVQLDGGNASVGGSKSQIYGDTAINGKTEVKGDLKAPKGQFDNLEAKTSFKSQNISDGIAVPGAAAGGSLSAKLKTEDAPKSE